MKRARRRAGFTLIEIMVALAILAILSVISIASILKFAASTQTRTQNSALGMVQLLNVAKMMAIGSNNNVVVFFDSAGFYGACVDTDGNNTCSAAEQANLRIPMPDVSGGLNGVKLDRNVNFGTIAQVAPHVAQNELAGNSIYLAGTGYYQNTDASAIGTGISTNPIVFQSRLGTTNCSDNTPCNYYVSSRKDDDISYHYAVNVSTSGKISLFQWQQVGGAWRWKMK